MVLVWASSLTISRAPRSTPHSMFENHSSSCARPSSGSSTKSANGFSSNSNENDLLSAVQFVMVGVMLRKILKPSWDHVSDEADDKTRISDALPLRSCQLFLENCCIEQRLSWPENPRLDEHRCCSPSSQAVDLLARSHFRSRRKAEQRLCHMSR